MLFFITRGIGLVLKKHQFIAINVRNITYMTKHSKQMTLPIRRACIDYEHDACNLLKSVCKLIKENWF